MNDPALFLVEMTFAVELHSVTTLDLRFIA